MKIRYTGDPNVIEARTTTSLIMLIIGLPLLLFGIIIISAVFIPAEVRDGNPIPWFVGLPGGGLFLIMGGFFAISWRSVRIDRRNGIVEDCRAIFFPIMRTTYKLNEFKYLLIQISTEGSGRIDYTLRKNRISYEVDLVGTHSRAFGIYGKKEDAIEAAERLSRFLHFDVHDKSDGELIVREAGTMDEKLKDRMRRLQSRVELPKPPDELKSSIRKMDGSVVVNLPTQYYSNGPLTLLILMGTLVYTLCLEDIWPKWAEDLARLSGGFLMSRATFTFTGILLTVVLSGLYFALAMKRVSVSINARSVTFKIKRLLSIHVTEILYDELEDLHVTGGGGIYARSDKNSFAFGENLTQAESEYICAMIKSSVASS